MSDSNPDLREEFNASNPNRVPDAHRAVRFGDMLAALVADMTPTESAAAVSSNAKTLAYPCQQLWDVVATAGTSTGRKTLVIGDATITPKAGEVVWDGGTGVRFAAADAVTAASFRYARGDTPQNISMFSRALGQIDKGAAV